MEVSAIETEGLTRDFSTVRALDGLTMSVPRGIIFGFLGPNGAGKTTTIRLLLGLLEPTQGRARVLGLDTVRQGQEVRSRCGALLEYPGLYERLSAEDNLEFYGRVWCLSRGERQARSKELLQQMGLWERRREAVSGWSRGMRQKLAVARALLHRPEVLFLDEPTAGLDAVASLSLREDLANLATGEGVTVFLTTHNLSEAERLCQEVAVVRRGRLLALGTRDELLTRSAGAQVEVIGRGIGEGAVSLMGGRPEVATVALRDGVLVLDLVPGAEVAPLVSELVAAGVAVEEVRKARASLEDAFLDLVGDE